MPRVTGSQRIVSPEEMLADLKHFVFDLRQSDKLAFLGAFATVLLCFIPWKSTAAEGEILGLVSSGFIVLVASVIGMASIAIRVRKVMPQLNPVVPWLVQAGSGALAILWCLVFIKISWINQQVPADIGNAMVPISEPTWGVILGLISSSTSMFGTILGLREKPA
jgi:hypothetical protein